MTNSEPKISYQDIDNLLEYLTVFQSNDFVVGKTILEEGTFPYWEYSEPVENFIKTFYECVTFDNFNWPEWQDEAEKYWNDPELNRVADIETCLKLLMTHIRKDRFCEGHLAAAFENGQIVAILERMKQLSAVNE